MHGICRQTINAPDLNMLNIPSSNTDPSYRYKMPKLVTKIEGRGNGIKTNLVNMSEVSRALKTPASYPTKFFGIEVGAQSKYDDTLDRAIVNGAFEQPFMQEVLDRFIEKYILCAKCRLPELNMAIEKRTIVAKCKACGWAGSLDNCHKLATFILNNPPNGEKNDSKDNRKKEKSEKHKESDDEKEKPEKSGKTKKSEKSHDSVDEGHRKEKKEKKKKHDEVLVDQGAPLTLDADMATFLSDVVKPLSSMFGSKIITPDDLFTEMRVKQLALNFGHAERLFCGLAILFDSEGLSGKSMTTKLSFVKRLLPNKCVDTAGVCAVYERYFSLRHNSVIKDYPLILKSLYDADLVSENSLIKRYSSEGKSEWLGFQEAKKRATPFIEWLKAEDDSDDSDSEDEMPPMKAPEVKEQQDIDIDDI